MLAHQALIFLLFVAAPGLHLLAFSENCVEDVGIKKRLKELLFQKQQSFQAGLNPDNPALSCQSILQANSNRRSGYYWVQTSNGSAVQVYCHMQPLEYCEGESGWLRLGSLNMTNSSEECPSDLVFENYGYDIRLCTRTPANRGSCASVIFNQNRVLFSEVCGWVRGYHYRRPNAFRPGTYNDPSQTLDGIYGEIVSFTYGNPRRHLWSYAIGNSEGSSGQSSCPCNEDSVGYTPPYVGEHWYCESGYSSGNRNLLYLTDPLWDGEGCGGREAPCCTNPNLPWFHRQLNNTTDGIVEIRACANEAVSNEDTPVEAFEIYIR